MDPVTTSQLTFVVSRLADGALGEAGKQAWEALAGLARRLRHREPSLCTALEAPDARNRGQVDVAGLARALVREAAADPDFAASLQEWWATADRLVRDADQGNVNVVSGTVHGPSVQARDITGSISFGAASPTE